MDDYKIDERKNEDNNQEPIITNEQKELTYTPSLYKRISDKYYALVDKLHLRPITDKIDKVMPSMIFFGILALIIIVLIIYFILVGLSGASVNEYSLSFTLNEKAYSGDYLINLSGNDSIQLITSSKAKGETKFLCQENVSVNAKITISGQTYNKSFKTDKKKINFDIVTNVSVDNTSEKKKENIFSFALVTPNGSLDKSGIIKANCDDFSQEYNFSNGLLNNIKMPCKIVSVNVNVEGIPPVSQMCNPGLCKINMSDNLSTNKIDQIVPTNKLVIYVNNKDGSSAVGINVEILEDSVGQELVDNGKTKDFGAYNIDLMQGDYIVNISDPLGNFASQQKKVKVTAGNLEPLIFVLDVPAIGNILINFNVEDSNVLSGTIFLKDENQNILQTKPFDSNMSVSFPMSVKGNYNISTKLNNQYISDYITQDLSVIYDLESGDKTVENVIRKMNPFLDQNIIIQVTELQTGKPIPFAKIYFKNLSKQNEFLTNVGFVNADSNGVYSLILPVGQYGVFLDHFSLGGKAAFSIIETKSLILTSQFVNLKVDWGNSKINVCLFEGKMPLDDAFIEVYSVERGLELTFYVDKNVNCASTEVKKLENIYLHVIKSGYLDLYSQTIFMDNDASKDKPKELNLNLSQIVPVNPINDLESEFLGIYNDNGLTSSANKITGPTDTSNGEYYYAFKVKLPKAKALQNRTINFYGLAGDKKDENVELSKMIAEYVSSIGQSKLYSNYNPEFNDGVLKLAEIGENNKYKAKTFVSNYTFTNNSTNDLEIIYTVLVRVTNNIIETEMGDNLFFWYDFKLDNDKPNLKSILKKIGTQKCTDPICVDAYLGGYQIMNSTKVPAKGNIYGKIFFNNSDEKSLIIYNKNENGSDKKEDIKDIFIVLDKNNSFILPVNIFGEYSFSNLELGPIYYDNLINAESADFNLNYELISNDNSAIIFRPYYNGVWDKNNEPVSININIEETEQLVITGIPEFIVPFVSNNFLLTVKQTDDSPAVNAEVKYYIKKSGESWKLIETYYASNSGNVEINTIPLAIGDKTKIIIYFQGYEPFVSDELNSEFTYLTVDDSVIDIKYPESDSLSPAEKEVNVTNNSNVDMNIFNVNYYLDLTSIANPDFVNKFLNLDNMKKHFENGELLSFGNKLSLFISYNSDLLLQNGRTVNLDETVSFNFAPKGTDAQTILDNLNINLLRTFNTKMEFGFSGKPDGLVNDCIWASLAKVKKDGSLDLNDNQEMVFLDGLPTTHYQLRILNWCTLQGSPMDFDKLELSIKENNSNISNLVIKGINTSNNNSDSSIDSFTFDSLVDNVILLDAGKQGLQTYDLNFIIQPGFVKGTDKTITFNFKPYYKTSELNIDPDYPMKSLQLNVKNSDFATCLYFGLRDKESNKQFLMVDLLPDSGLDDSYLRLPYNFESKDLIDQYSTYLSIPGVQDNVDGESFKYDPSSFNIELDSQYANDYLQLELKNNCGIDLEYDLNFVYDLKLFMNEPFEDNTKIFSGQTKTISIFRDTYYDAGPHVLGLYIKNPITYIFEPIKFLKINVESSVIYGDYKYQYFIENPFYDSKTDNTKELPVFYNNYYQYGELNNLDPSYLITSNNGIGVAKEFIESTKNAKWNEYPWNYILPTVEWDWDNGILYLNPDYFYCNDDDYSNCEMSCHVNGTYCSGAENMSEFSPFYKIDSGNVVIKFDHKNYNYLFYHSLGNGGSENGIFTRFILRGLPQSEGIQKELESQLQQSIKNYILASDKSVDSRISLDFMQREDIRSSYYNLINSFKNKLLGYILIVGSGTSDDRIQFDQEQISAYCAPGYESKYISTSINNEGWGVIDKYDLTSKDGVYTLNSGGPNNGDRELTKYGIVLYCRLSDFEIKNNSINPKINRGYRVVDINDLGTYKISRFDLSTLPVTTFANTMPECNGGFTGPSYKPAVDYSNTNEECIINSENNNNTVNACSLKSFANLILKHKNDVNPFKVKLMNDDYRKENLQKMENEFLSKLKSFDIIYLDGQPVGELSPGIYNVKIDNQDNKDENIKVYISYSSFILPDHLFYYLPYDETADNYGTSTNLPIDVVQGFKFPFSESTKGLRWFDVITTSFDALNTNGPGLGLVLQGNVKENKLAYNNLSISVANIDLKANKEITLNANYGDEEIDSYTLQQNWFVDNGTGDLIYPETVGIKIDELTGNEIRITNTTNNNFILKRAFFVPDLSAFNIDSSDKIIMMPKQYDVSSLQNIITQIGSGNICYKKDSDNYYYYYSINKLLN